MEVVEMWPPSPGVALLHQADCCPSRCAPKPPCSLLLQPQLPHAVPVPSASPWPPGQSQLPQGKAGQHRGSQAPMPRALRPTHPLFGSRCLAPSSSLAWKDSTALKAMPHCLQTGNTSGHQPWAPGVRRNQGQLWILPGVGWALLLLQIPWEGAGMGWDGGR